MFDHSIICNHYIYARCILVHLLKPLNSSFEHPVTLQLNVYMKPLILCFFAILLDNSADPCRARPDGYYADGGDCRRFYRCLGHHTQRRICLRGWHFNAARRVCTLGNCAVYPDYGSSVDNSRNSNSKSSGGNMISPKYIKNSDLIWEGSGDSGDDFMPGLVGPDGNFLLEKPKMASAAGEEQSDGQEATSLAVSAKRGQSAQIDAGFDNELSYDEFFSDDPRKVSYTYNEEDSLDIEDQLLMDYLVYNLGVLPVQ